MSPPTWTPLPSPTSSQWNVAVVVVVQSLTHVRLFATHGLQHARLPCPSLSPGVCSNSCPLSRWCHPTILFPVALFSSCPQYFPASGSFLVSWLFITDGQSIGASSSVLPKNIQGWFPLGLTDMISLLSQESSSAPQFKSIILSLLYGPTHICTWLLEKPYIL